MRLREHISEIISKFENMRYIISILFLLISVSSYGQRISELSTTTDGRDGRLPIILPSGSPSGWTTFAISYDNLVQYLETDIANNLSRIGEVSDSLTIAYDTVFDAWTAIVEIRTRNDNQTDSLEALYDTASVHLDTLDLHRTQITSILSDLDTKLEVTDTINHADTSFTVKFSDGFILKDSTDLGSDSVEYADKAGELRTDQMTSNSVLLSSITTATHDPNLTWNGTNSRLTSEGNAGTSPAFRLRNSSGNEAFFQYSNASGVSSFISLYNNAGGHIKLGNSSTGWLEAYTDSIAINTTLVLSDGYEINGENDLGTGGSTDSNFVTVSMDTAKALNNSDIFFTPDITAGNNIIKGNGQLRLFSQEGTNTGTNIQLYPSGTGNSSGRVTIEADQTRFSSSDVWVDVLRADDLGTQDLTIASASSGNSVIIRPDGSGSATAQTEFSTTLADFGTKADFDSTITLNTTEQVWDSIAFSSTINVDFTDGSDYKMVVVTGDVTINITDLYGGESVLWIIQDGTGSHTVTKGTGWGDLRGSGTISPTADEISVVQFQKAVGPDTYSKIIHWID